jgi:RNA polymerase sigma factor (sigma-70 family)
MWAIAQCVGSRLSPTVLPGIGAHADADYPEDPMLAAQELLIDQEYRSGREALVRRLTALTRDREEATDLAHEAFLRLAREVVEGRTPATPAAWLYRVGSNLALSRGRRIAVADRHAATLPRPATAPAPEQLVVKAELGRALRIELGRLAAQEHQAVLLAAQGYQPSEIAAVIGRTPGATRTMLCRARAKLRIALLAADAA